MNQNSKYVYYFTSPTGNDFDAVYNLSEFCKDNDLDAGTIRRICRGKGKTYKGWQVYRKQIKVGENFCKNTVDIFNIRIPKKSKISSNVNNVLAISDLHIPFENKYALEFVVDIYKKYNCNRVVFMGDIFDCYSLSRYTKSPSSLNASDEFEEAKNKAKLWTKAFPEADCIVGNHEARINKKFTENGIPKAFLKSFNELFGLPDTWHWSNEVIIDDTHYIHGNRDGMFSHVNIARDSRASTVTAHTHTSAGTHFLSNFDSTIFALNCGCLIDQKTYAFAYSAEQSRKAVLGTGIVLNNLPSFIPMS